MAIDALVLFLVLCVMAAIAGILLLYGTVLCIIVIWMMARNWYLNQIKFEDANV
jgi:hypothetical protein